MSYPRHYRHRANDNQAKAPYNFVPLPDRIYCPDVSEEPDHSRYMPERHSGVIELSITTESWLFTRAAVTPEYARDHDDAQQDAVARNGSAYREFFHHGDALRPVIPGSSVRGMLRQLVEVMSDSALTTASTKGIVHRAVGDPTWRVGREYRERFVGTNTRNMQYPVREVKGGYLYRHGREWRIQPAVDHHGESFVRYNGALPARMAAPGHYDVWVMPEPRGSHVHTRRTFTFTLNDPRTSVVPVAIADPRPAGTVAASLVVTEGVGNSKHMHLAVFEPDVSAVPLRVPSGMRRQFEDDHLSTQRDPNHPGRWPLGPNGTISVPDWSGAGQFHGWPCFFMVDSTGELVYFGGTLFFRLPYRHAPADLAPSSPDDFARRLFGSVATGAGTSEGAGGPRRGRLSVSDFVWDEAGGSPFVPEYGGYVSPAVLLGPKPACVQNYLVQPEEDAANNRHYDDPPPSPGQAEATPQGLIRGFKHYWHRRGAQGPEEARSQSQAANHADVLANRRTRTVVHPVRDGVRFAGCIRFDNLTDSELGALLMAVQLPDTKRHKLGMARKHGYGSVRLAVVGLRLVDPGRRCRRFFGEQGNELDSGWKDAIATQEVSTKTALAFAAALVAHRGDAADASEPRSVLERYWGHPRMVELSELLEWSQAPAVVLTEEVGVQGAGALQWRKHWLLPTPHAVTHPNEPSIWPMAPAPTPGDMPRTPGGEGAQRAAPERRVPPPPPPPVEEEWDGRLTWSPGNKRIELAGPGNAKALATGDSAKALLGSMGDAAKKLQKQGFVSVKARVRRDGNQATILSVTPQP